MFFKHFSNKILSKKRIYLDYASSTPIDNGMVKSFPILDRSYLSANPSALHKEGVALKNILNSSRDLVAKTISSQKEEIIFTSSATESDNLAILGFIKHQIGLGINTEDICVITTPFEHSAVESSVLNLDKKIKVLKLDQQDGFVLPNSLSIPQDAKVVLVSVIFVQNEIGTTQDIKEISKRIRKLRKEHTDKQIVFHIDATQAPLYYELNVLRLGIDMMTLGSTKLYCSKGIGMLYKKRNINLSPIFYGGGQEFGLRPGTEPVELIHSFSHALAYAQKNREKEFEKIKNLQEYFENKVLQELPIVKITKSGDKSLGERSPHITHMVLPNIDSELFVIELDARGIAVSSKSACKNDLPAQADQDSGIMSLLYPNQNLGAIRVSYGRKTTKKQLDRAIKAIKKVLEKYSKN